LVITSDITQYVAERIIMEINRRKFMAAAISGIALGAFGCASDDSPSAVGPKAIGPSHGTKVDVGTPADYAVDGATDQFAKSDGVIVARAGGKIYATSALCTHQACALKLAGGQLRCPCHGSRFDLRGAVIKGPARESLAYFAIALSDQGRLIVDKTHFFADASAKGSFVQVS
jgi:cytochrome b6-f complex iron-sulfur subunit